EKKYERGHREAVFCTAISPDGKQFASGSSDRTIKLWDIAAGNVIREFVNPSGKNASMSSLYAVAHPGWVYSLRLTNDGKYLVSAGNAPRNKGFLAVWNVADGRLMYSQEYALGPIYSVAVSPDGKLLALACGSPMRQSSDGYGYVLRMPAW